MANITIDDQIVQENIKRLADGELNKGIKECLDKACLLVVRDAKQRCPGGTGELRRSIQYEVTDEGNEIAGYIGSGLNYAPFVHQGTGVYALEGNGRKNVPWVYYDEKNDTFVSTEGIKPTPFIQNAIDANKQAIIQAFQDLLGGIKL